LFSSSIVLKRIVADAIASFQSGTMIKAAIIRRHLEMEPCTAKYHVGFVSGRLVHRASGTVLLSFARV
jgi:hypothetical protein